ncbi:MAG: hypothetical protein KAS16_07690 [Thermoplasmata archaeon]|nr:hypothetical protein [Thermoplasmata archaeon]
MKKLPDNLLILLLSIMAFTVRLIPTMTSELPFNIDGYPLARISEIILSTNHLPDYTDYSGLLGYNMRLPIFPLLLSQFSLLTGIAPLELLPYFTAFIGSFSVVIIYALVSKLFGNQPAAFMAGIFLAFTGLFVYVTTAAMKELLGIVILCLLVYTYGLREDWRFRMISAALLIYIPFIHHLTGLIAFIIISLVSVNSILMANKHEEKFFKFITLEIMTGPALGIVVLLYYLQVGMPFFSDVNNLNDSTLLFSVCILALLAHLLISQPTTSKPWFVLPSRDKHNDLSLFALFDEKVMIVVIGIAILYLNSRVSLFASAPKTTGLLLNLMMPYFILAMAGMAGFNILRYSNFKYKTLMIAMFFAPLTLMVFSSLRGLDIYNFTLTIRSYNFIDIPMAITAGIGTAYLIKLATSYAKRHGRALMIIPVAIFTSFCLLSIMAIPLAYDRVEAFGIQEESYEYELDAMDWVAEANITAISTDQRIMDIIGPYFDIHAKWDLPWQLERGYIGSNETAMVSEDWTSIGAQIFIMERVVIEEGTFNTLLNRSNVVYSGGPSTNNIYIIITRG